MFNKSAKSKEEDFNSRQAILWMHPSALIPMMTSNRWVITDGHLPEDVRFHHVFWNTERQVWGVVCTSMTFKPVLAGATMPELPPVKFRFYNPAKDGIIE